MDAAVLDELGQGEPGDLAPDRVEATDEHRLGGVVDDEVDAGRLLEGADVATLAADDAALHLVRRDGHRRDGHLRGVVHHDALDGGDHDFAGAFFGRFAGRALDGPGQADRIVLGLVPDLLEQDGLRLVRAHAADTFEGLYLLLLGMHQALSLRLELLLAGEQLAAPLLEHVRPLVELLVPLEQSTLEVGEVRALGSPLLLELPLQSDLLVLRLEDELLLLRTGLGDDAARLVMSGLHRLRRDDAAGQEAHDQTAGDRRQHDHYGDDVTVHGSLPSGPGSGVPVGPVTLTVHWVLTGCVPTGHGRRVWPGC